VEGFGGYSSKEPTGMVIIPRPRKRSFDLEKGIACAISSWIRIDDHCVPPRVKAGSNYQNSRLATIQIKVDGYDQPILLNSNGKVSESGGSCFFMVRRGVVVTPPITSNILESVTRNTVIELFEKELKIPVDQRQIDRTELYVCDEAFLCGSGAEIGPVTSVDRIPVGNGEVGAITHKIVELYFSVVRGEAEAYHRWLTPTYR
jgi:branched-chain amino acid aminotransferase